MLHTTFNGKENESKQPQSETQSNVNNNTNSNNNSSGNGKEKNNKNGVGNGVGNGNDSESSIHDSSIQDNDLNAPVSSIHKKGNREKVKSKKTTTDKNEKRPDPAPNIQPFVFETNIQSNLSPLKMDDINKCKSRNEEIQMIGDRLHPIVLNKISDGNLAGQVTGMLLEMDPSDIVPVLENENEMSNYIMRAQKEIAKNGNNNNSQQITASQLEERVNKMKKQHQNEVSRILTNSNPSGDGKS